MPLWLFGYFMVGNAIYWPLQTFLPNQAAGWTAFVGTVAVWLLIRRGRLHG